MKFIKRTVSLLFVACFFMLFYACDNKEEIKPDTILPEANLTGTGSFVFDSFQPLSNKPTVVFYHIPDNATSSSQVLIVFHGAGRDALENRDALIAKANQYGTVLIVPEYSTTYFPGGDGYNLGNVFVDGDNPSAASLNNEGAWAFSLIEPLFDEVKQRTGNTSLQYNVFGFSAGGQFAHRFAFLKPGARFNKLVAASSGWYTMPNHQVNFPYGLKESPVLLSSMSSIFSKDLTVLIGEADTNPNDGIRRNAFADVQGTNRYVRAQYFYNQSNLIAQSQGATFNWNYFSLPNVNHNFIALANYAFDSIFY